MVDDSWWEEQKEKTKFDAYKLFGDLKVIMDNKDWIKLSAYRTFIIDDLIEKCKEQYDKKVQELKEELKMQYEALNHSHKVTLKIKDEEIERLKEEIKRLRKDKNRELQYILSDNNELKQVIADLQIKRVNEISRDKVDEIFKDVESMLVMPYEGCVMSTDLSGDEMHKQITDFTRTQFNKVKNKWVQK